jgi:hypothetical protein
MKKRKVLVYDNQKYFLRLLRYEFQEDFTFDIYRSFEYFDSVLKDYSVIIFVIYSEEELLDFIKICGKGIPLIVCTYNKKILLGMEGLDNIFLLDTSILKSEILNELKYYLHGIILNVDENIKL